MDKSIFTSPLESNLSRLITERLLILEKRFTEFLKFTDRKRSFHRLLYHICVVVNDLEEDKALALGELQTDSVLPDSCNKWIGGKSSNSSAFVTCYTQDFRPKLAEEIQSLQQETSEALEALKRTTNSMDEPAEVILKHLKLLLKHFKSAMNTDPWLHELAIRHHSARFLVEKAKYLECLHKTYIQVRALNNESSLKLERFSLDFFEIVCRFDRGSADLFESAPGVEPQPFNSSHWTELLHTYSLDYEWTLACPPLDGFLSTLYTHLKSHGAVFPRLSNGTSEEVQLPAIFSEESLRYGFLQKSVSSLLSRSWQCNFCILQPSTGFLHLYKESLLSSNDGGNGHLLVPSSLGSSGNYSKTSLNDINSLAFQFLMQNPHYPAFVAPELLTPSLSIPIRGTDCKIVATDPDNFAFLVRPGRADKIVLKAFCEEEFVDWVIALNEVASNKTNTKSTSPTPQQKYVNTSNASLETQSYGTCTSNQTTSTSTSSSSDSSPQLSQQRPISAAPPIVDLENPWE